MSLPDIPDLSDMRDCRTQAQLACDDDADKELTRNMEGPGLADHPQHFAYRKESRALRIAVVVLLVIAALIVPVFAPLLDGVHLFGFPIGYFLTAQGAIILCVAALFWFVTMQYRTDGKFGVVDDE